MPHSFKLSRRIARLRVPFFAALIAALGACDNGNSFTSDSGASSEPQIADQGLTIDEPATVQDGDAALDATAPAEGLSLASVSFSGGIPFGTYHQPNTEFGTRYNGALRNIYPQYVASNLAAIKSRGGKVILSMAGSESNYRDASGNFSLSKWKARIDRYKGIDLARWVQDGTLIGHYLMDEPNDPTNWNGKQVSPATVEEMARYSKALFPSVPTIVRAYPDYMSKYSGTYRYLDAAWAQYVVRKGNVNTFIADNVSKAKSKGLALVVGLNILKGNNGSPLSATQVKSFGAALLSSTYPCAFISWQYSSSYLSSSSIKSAMDYLRDKSESRSLKSCRGS